MLFNFMQSLTHITKSILNQVGKEGACGKCVSAFGMQCHGKVFLQDICLLYFLTL